MVVNLHLYACCSSSEPMPKAVLLSDMSYVLMYVYVS